MQKKHKTTSREESAQTLTGLPQSSLIDIRGGDTAEPSPEEDNEIRAHIIETG